MPLPLPFDLPLLEPLGPRRGMGVPWKALGITGHSAVRK